MIKTPVQWLNERCAKVGIAPAVYECEQKQILPVSLFQATCVLKLNEETYVALGSGVQKKQAQHDAAKTMFMEKLKIGYEDEEGFNALLKKNTGTTMKDIQQLTNSMTNSKTLNQRDVLLDDVDYPQASSGNPIAELEDFCRKYRLPDPKYDMNGVSVGPSHCPALSVPCTVGKMTLTGRSKTKKMAKRIVAVKVLTELRNRFAASGCFGDDVRLATAPPEKTPQEEMAKHLSLLNSNNTSTNNANYERSKKKTYEDFLNFAQTLERNSEFAQKLRNHPGPHFQQVLKFARTVDEQFPLIGNPYQFYYDFLKKHEKGVMGFYHELKKELEFEESWNTKTRPGDNHKDKFMVMLEVTLPGIEFQPLSIRVGEDIEQLKEITVIEFVTYLCTMTAFQIQSSKKAN